MNLKALVCQYDGCKLILEHPVTLPCGYSLCKNHLDQFNHKFECFFCKKEHQIPDDGFAINHTFNMIIDSYFDMDSLRKQIKYSFNKLNEILYEYENINPECYIYDYIRDIINKVDLHREQLIKDIHERSDKIINQLQEKEQLCQANAIKLEKINLKELKTTDLSLWKHSYRTIDSKKEELNDLLAKMNDKLTLVRNESIKFKNNLLQNETIFFKKADTIGSFGDLSFYLNKTDTLSKNCGELIKSFDKHSGCITSIQVDEKSNKLISGSENGTIKIFNLETGECLKTLKENQLSVILLLPNDRFISSSLDARFNMWNLNSYKCLFNYRFQTASVSSFCLISDNEIACGCQDGYIRIVSLDDMMSTKIKKIKAHDYSIRQLLLFNKTNLISCSRDKIIKILHLERIAFMELKGHSDIVNYIEITSDGLLLSCSQDKTVKLWQIETGKLIKSIQFEHPVKFVKKLNQDLIAIVFANNNNIDNLLIYDLTKMQAIKTITIDSSFISRLHLLTNGNLLTGSDDGEVKLWKIFD